MQRVYRTNGEREGGNAERVLSRIERIAEGAYRIPSFSDPEKDYIAHASGYCGCLRGQIHGNCEKHPCLADALETVRGLRFGREVAERKVVELCLRIFAPRNTDCLAAYELFVEVSGCRYSTGAMRAAARRRHMRALQRFERRAS